MSGRTTCVIAGGGPAGMVLGLLLGRAGVDVTVLEKHGDFLRDFRGDTVHPTTLQLLDDLGLSDDFAELPQTRVNEIVYPRENSGEVVFADLKRLKVAYPYIAMVPQWDLLDLLASAGRKEPTFTLRMNTEVTGVVRQDDAVVGVRYRDRSGTESELRADLTVATDGRWSTVRATAGLTPRESPVGFDAWWLRLPSRPDDAIASLRPNATRGHLAVAIPREGYFQIAYFAPKGADAEFRSAGVEPFRERIAVCLPALADRVDRVESMDDVKHLDVRLNRLRRWHAPGVLCIGDAAHAMSPMAGVGINLAVQDAVAAASILAGPLKRRELTVRHLAAVRRRRWLPTFIVQKWQDLLHRNVVQPVLEHRRDGMPPFLVKLVERVPLVAVLPAHLIGTGVRSEPTPAFAKRDANAAS